MAHRLDEIVDKFSLADDDELRLELLLDFARKLPPLPEELQAERDAGLNRVPECMSPVFMWITPQNGGVRICVDVAEEAPTVKGFCSILVRAYDGATAAELAEVPNDLINRLGLTNQIRMNRWIGLTAIVGRIRRRGRQLQEAATSDQ